MKKIIIKQEPLIAKNITKQIKSDIVYHQDTEILKTLD